ncbi:hypothetical protein H312_01364 [Anncaliia algerae PRA339]|uniref:Uncharacterized protein n=1 Tax=Anncaliia algerae PRA339 TaxID=1288291 RepID=A0A059F1Q5_9MICR|nr:hypothetical protein H312_01364 [Anncaliia algerae PRA339]
MFQVRLLYFEGIQRNKIANIRLLLAARGISMSDVFNISFDNSGVLELLVKKQRAEMIILGLEQVKLKHLKNYNPCIGKAYMREGMYDMNYVSDEVLRKGTSLFKERMNKAYRDCMAKNIKRTANMLDKIRMCNPHTIQTFSRPTFSLDEMLQAQLKVVELNEPAQHPVSKDEEPETEGCCLSSQDDN